MTYIFLAIIKIIDNIILTVKSIATYRNKRLFSSCLVCVSQFLFYLVIDKVTNDKTLISIVVVSIASGIGTYVAFMLSDKYKKDSKWYYYITCSDKDEMMILSDYLVEHKIKYMANLGLTRKGKETINLQIFSQTKNESRLIEEFIKNSDIKFLKEIQKG